MVGEIASRPVMLVDNITQYDHVEGYCDRLSAVAGETIGLCASSALAFDVAVHRWTDERVLVWQSDLVAAGLQAVPVDADSNGCGWRVSVQIPIGPEWPSGFYLVTMTAHGAPLDRATGYAYFVVRSSPATSERPPLLLVLATNTWNAYNTWGGCSLYTGGHQVSFARPLGRGLLIRPMVDRDDRKSWPTRHGELPDVDGARYQQYRADTAYPGFVGSTGWFSYERRFVEWAHRCGITFDMATSADLESSPEIVDGYRAVMGVGHDEYWSSRQRQTIEDFVQAGGNYASMSGNTMFWQVRMVDDGRSMVCYKYSAHDADPVMGTTEQTSMTGMWCDPVVKRPETALLGAGSAYGLYSRFGQATPRGSGGFTVYRHDHWMFADTGLRYGDVLGSADGVVGYETVGCRLGFDEYQLPIAAGSDGTPMDTTVVAFTPSSNLAMGEYPASIAALGDQGDLEFVAERLYGSVDADSIARARYGNAVMLTCRPYGPTGGEVVTIGSTDWVFGLANDGAVSQVTRNVVQRMIQQVPGTTR